MKLISSERKINVMFTAAIVRIAIFCALLVLGGSAEIAANFPSNQTWTIPGKVNGLDGGLNDGEFLMWSFHSVPKGGSAGREDSGGNPGARLRISTSAPAATNTVTAIKDDFVSNIPFEGDTFTFSVDFLSDPGAFGDGQAILILVEQGSDIYGFQLGITGVQATWTTLMFNGTFNQAAFAHIVGGGAPAPNFTSGVPSKFGLAGQNTFSSITNYYDNFHLVSEALPTPTPTPTPTASPTPTATPTAPPAKALNISTRLRVDTGNNVLIGGFIVTGTAPKNVVARGLGPSLAQFGVPDFLVDPILELHNSSGALLMQNDNWQDDPAAAGQLTKLGLGLPDPNESGLITTLQPGAYTAILAGNNGGTGVGLVEVYDVNQNADSELANISTRGFVLTGNNVMIGGFILGGPSNNTHVVVRGIGPSLIPFGVPNALVDPTLELHDGSGALLVSNDNWQDDATSAAHLVALGLAPQNPLESGIYMSLPPGAFTAILAGNNNGTGVGLVEVYNVH